MGLVMVDGLNSMTICTIWCECGLKEVRQLRQALRLALALDLGHGVKNKAWQLNAGHTLGHADKFRELSPLPRLNSKHQSNLRLPWNLPTHTVCPCFNLMFQGWKVRLARS